VTEILLDGHITSYNVPCLGVVIDAKLTFATHVKRVAGLSGMFMSWSLFAETI